MKSNTAQASGQSLKWALAYAALGWAVVPLWRPRDGVCTCQKGSQCERQGKHPRTRHGHLDGSIDPGTIGRWKWATANVGIVTGRQSGLLVIDIDPRHGGDHNLVDLQNRLGLLPAGPVVETRGGGVHLYFKLPAGPVRKTSGVEGIDLKGDGGYVAAPPSLHFTGITYRWRSPPETALPDLPAAWISWLAETETPPVTESTESTERTETTESTEPTEEYGKQYSLPVGCPDKFSPEEAILASLPSGIGQRHRKVFELARCLKAIPWLADADVDSLEPYVRKWHELGLQRGVIATVPFEETWIDFLKAWPRVKFPRGGSPMSAIVGRVRCGDLPATADRYEDQRLKLLVGVCTELQRVAGEAPFFLGCRTAGKLLGVGHVQAWRWLFLLQHHHVIAEVEKGDRGRRRASRYRYLGVEAAR